MRKEFAGLSQRTVRVERLQQQARTVRKVGFEKLNTLLRQDCLADLSSDDFPYWLTSRRFGLYSQNGEDGMIVALLSRCGVANRTFVEIGSGAGGGNSGLLAAEFGWRGLMVELDPVRQKRCARQFADEGRVACVCSRASPENINQLIDDHGLSGEVDMFSLDIDSYDYWVFEAMTACQPRLMVLEYNARFGPSAEVTVPLDAPLDKGPKGYYGASLGALTRVAEAKGYRLVACDPSGTNAFFLRNDLCPDIPAVPVDRAFRWQMDRTDEIGQRERKRVNMVKVAKRLDLPLHFL